jgi:hypothetical protein
VDVDTTLLSASAYAALQFDDNPSVAASTAVSLFQSNSKALKAERLFAVELLHDAGAAWIDAPTGPRDAPATLRRRMAEVIGEAIAKVSREIRSDLAALAAHVEAIEQRPTAAVKYCGVFEPGKAYRAGDLTTCGGGLWCAKESRVVEPGSESSWVLIVKRGRAA